ncbi:uncharacterized protein [Anabrus simplex]|uniref:uncharacterized protein n=1 Tax=Anabrus simplex TaxID=316456 RepID=UPI0035A2A4C7
MGLLLMLVVTAVLVLSSYPALCKMCYFVEGGRSHKPSDKVCVFQGGSMITAPNSERCVNCTQLDASGNNITSLYRETLLKHPKLITLWANNNSISTISEDAFSSLSHITIIFLSNNSLTRLPVNVFKNNLLLRRLHLDNNPLTLPANGPFLRSSSVKHLDLTSCNLTYIPKDSFIEMSNLSRLWLAENKLSYLSGNIFYPLKHLTYLNITLNMITDLKFIKNSSVLEVIAEHLPLNITPADTYISSLQNLTLSRRVCCCDACVGSLKLRGEDWLIKCSQCLQPFPRTVSTTSSSSTTTLSQMTPTLTNERRNISNEVTTSTSVFLTRVCSREQDYVLGTTSGNMMAVIILLAVLLALVSLILIVYVVVSRLRKKKKRPKQSHPEFLIYKHNLQPVHCRQSYISCNSSGRCTCCHNTIVTDLDISDDNYRQNVNHLYESVNQD